MGRSAQSYGFTLIELMIVVALLGIFAVIAVPSFTTLITNSRTQSASNELLSFLQYARSTAVQNRSSTTICYASGKWSMKKACTDANTTAARTLELPTNIDIAASATSFSFHSNGTASSNTTIIVCHKNEAINGFTLTVKSSGGTRLWPRGKTENSTSSMSTCTP